MITSPAPTKLRSFTFTCPVCGEHSLRRQTVTYKTYPIRKIKWNGVHDEGVVIDPNDGEVDSWEEHYQCAGCGEIFHTLDELLSTGHLKLLRNDEHPTE